MSTPAAMELSKKHANHKLVERLFVALNRHDHRAMAACYHPNATFRDIAFDLSGRGQIHCMWHMICEGDIHATFHVVHANDSAGHVKLVDEYTFGATQGDALAGIPATTGRPVRNVIDSHFRFRDGAIIEQIDSCDPRAWAAMALGGVSGFLAGRLAFLRRRKARQKLEAFLRTHPDPMRQFRS